MDAQTKSQDVVRWCLVALVLVGVGGLLYYWLKSIDTQTFQFTNSINDITRSSKSFFDQVADAGISDEQQKKMVEDLLNRYRNQDAQTIGVLAAGQKVAESIGQDEEYLKASARGDYPDVIKITRKYFEDPAIANQVNQELKRLAVFLPEVNPTTGGKSGDSIFGGLGTENTDTPTPSPTSSGEQTPTPGSTSTPSNGSTPTPGQNSNTNTGGSTDQGAAQKTATAKATQSTSGSNQNQVVATTSQLTGRLSRIIPSSWQLALDSQNLPVSLGPFSTLLINTDDDQQIIGYGQIAADLTNQMVPAFTLGRKNQPLFGAQLKNGELQPNLSFPVKNSLITLWGSSKNNFSLVLAIKL